MNNAFKGVNCSRLGGGSEPLPNYGCSGNFYKILGMLLLTISYVKKTRNIQKKSNENVQKRRFRVFSARKFFLKIGLGHILAIAITHFGTKNQ